MSDGAPPPPLPAEIPPPRAVEPSPAPAASHSSVVEQIHVRSARLFAGWTIGCTGLAVLCCGGGAWWGVVSIDGLARDAERELVDVRAQDALCAAAGSLLDAVGDRLRSDAPDEFPATLPEAPPKDPWGRPIRYSRASPRKATLTSDGPDGRPGSKDDITRVVELK